VNDPEHCDYTVQDPSVIDRGDGSSAIVFYTDTNGPRPSGQQYGKLAILSLPAGHSRYFSAVAFYFYDFTDDATGFGRVDIPLTDVRRVIESVEYFQPSL
jgi:hypothetical protein